VAQFRVEFVVDQATGKYLAELYNPDNQQELMVRTEAIYPSQAAAVLGLVQAVQGCDPEIPSPDVKPRVQAKQKRRRTIARSPRRRRSVRRRKPRRGSGEAEEARMRAVLFAVIAALAAPALADFSDKKPITATSPARRPSGYPRTMVEGLKAVVRDAYPGSAVSFKPNSPGGGVLAIADGQADFTATRPAPRCASPTRASRPTPSRSRASSAT
jgi:hypothetical protein